MEKKTKIFNRIYIKDSWIKIVLVLAVVYLMNRYVFGNWDHLKEVVRNFFH